MLTAIMATTAASASTTVGEHLRLPADFTQDYSVDSSRIRAELDYSETVSEEEALARTIEWERANPPADLKPEEFDYAAEDEALAKVT